MLILFLFTAMGGCGGSDDDLPASSVVWWVIPTGDGDFSDVQSCINAARDGDTCLVFPGVYTQNIDFGGKSLVVRGARGPEETVLDGGGLGPVVKFVANEDSNTVLSGFTVMNGYAWSSSGDGSGAGIRLWAASPSIRDCIIRDNTAEGDGGGIYCGFSGCRPRIENVIFQNNTAAGQGGGLYAFSGVPDMRNCLFVGNTADTGGAMAGTYGAQLSLSNGTVVDNQAGRNNGAEALYLYNASAQWTDTICGHLDWRLLVRKPLVVLHRNGSDPSLRSHSPTSVTLQNVDLEGGRASIARRGGCLLGICSARVRAAVRGDPMFRPLLGTSDNPLQAYYLFWQPDVPSRTVSPCLDAGSTSAEAAGVNSLTTQNGEYIAQQADSGTVDLGYHYAITVTE